MGRLAALAFCAAAGLAVFGCGSAPPASSVRRTSPVAAASPTPVESVTATPGAGRSTAPATCRLPVASGDAPVDGNPSHGSAGHGGFIQFPAGTFAIDPASLGSYDRARSRWAPVFRAWISPDGSQYAWPEYRSGPGPATGIIHVVDVATGADHPAAVPAPSMVVSFETDGVYVARVVPNTDAPPQGLTAVSAGPGGFRQIAADGVWTEVGGGYSFGADVDPTLGPTHGIGLGNRVRRLDLRTGATTVVATYPGASAQVLGVSGTTPLIAVTSGTSYVVNGPGGVIFSGPVDNSDPAGPVVVDGSTIWFSSLSGAVWRWDGSGSARRVATTTVSSIQVAGACR